VAALRRSAARLRLGLDARAGAGAAKAGRAAAGDLGPFRLERTDTDALGDPARRGVDHAWQRGRAAALVRLERPEGTRAVARRLPRGAGRKRGRELMRAFANLLDRLAFTPQRNGKLVLVRDYMRDTPDPERGWALAALTGVLAFDAAKPAF